MLNKVILIGRLGKDPEVRYMPNGEAVCNFRVATSSGKRELNGTTLPCIAALLKSLGNT